MLRSAVRPGFLALLLGLLGACAPTRPAPVEAPREDGAALTHPLSLRLIYLIHGDADYSYHDASGHRLFADREALKQALSVARNARDAEVFIFYQKPRGAGFWDGVPKSGTYFHYRGGALLRRRTYSRIPEDAYLQTEGDVMRRDSGSFKPDARTVLAYFGHEIPPANRTGYFASDPDRRLSIDLFADGLKRLDGTWKTFDLIVLSACYGGTPAMIQALEPLTKHVVASPAYLHLSYLDTRALGDSTADSPAGGPAGSIPALADSIAAQSFRHLKERTQTEITVAVYDLSRVQKQDLRKQETGKTREDGVWKDCARDPAFDSAAAAQGVKLYYQPPRFGALKGQATRSAWQCLF